MSDKQLQIVTVKNPFNPSDRLTRSVQFRPGRPVAEYIQDALAQADPGVELVVSRNGRRIPEADLARVQPRPGDYLLITPAVHGGGGDGGKNLAATLAGLALMVVTMGVGSVVAGGTFWGAGFAPIASWGWWAWAAAIGTSLVGGWLLSTLFPPPEAQDPPPGWNSLSPIQGQGSVVGETYGTTRTGGTVLQQRIVPDGDKQYLYYLATGGAGEIDDLDGVKIGKNPVENYNDVQLEYRLGANDQTIIPGFDDTLQTQILSYNLQQGADWSTQQTTEASGTGLEVILECPAGLYRREDDGDLKTATVQVELQYRAVGAVDWIAWPDSVTRQDNTARRYASNQIVVNGDKTAIYTVDRAVTVLSKNAPPLATTVVSSEYNPNTAQTVITLNNAVSTKVYAVKYIEVTAYHEISGATSSPVRRTIRLLDLAAAQYEVRARCIYKSGTGDRYATDIYWTALSHVITDDFIRPGKVLVGIRALATDQLQGAVPEITWLQTRENVWVWDPAENGGAGGYVQKPAYNPAWAAYDLIHRCRRIKNIHTGAYEFVIKGYPASRILYQEFADWADFCTARDLRFDYYYDQEMDLWSALKLPESLGRGKALMRGTRWGAMWDGPAEVAMQFDAGNIALDSFGLDYQGTKNRARAIEIRFRDAALDYEWNYVPVIPPGYDASLVPANPVRIDLPGCTRLDQAYREGRYRLWLNSLTRMASWGADVDAIGCQIGQRVRAAHDVLLPEGSVSGRLEDADADSVTLDRAVTLEPGKSYVAALRMPEDALVEKSLENQAATFSRASTAYLDGVEYLADAPRYLVGGGVMVEEGTTNLFDPAKNSSDVEVIEETIYGTPTTVYKLDAATNSSYEGFQGGGKYVVNQSSIYTIKAKIKWNERLLISNLEMRCYDSSDNYIGSAVITWKKNPNPDISKYQDYELTVSGFPVGTITCELLRWFYLDTNDTGIAYIAYVQIEQKVYATSWHLPGTSRARESLTLPNSGLSPVGGTLEVKVLIDAMARRQVTGQYPEIFNIAGGVQTQGILVYHSPTSAYWLLKSMADDGTVTQANFADSVLPDGIHVLRVDWTASAARLYIDANPTPAATISSPKLPSAFGNVSLGGRSDTTMLNSTIHAVRLSDIPRGAEGLSDAGTPFIVDVNTLGLWTFDHSLACQTQRVRVAAPFAADTEAAVYEDGTHFLAAGDRTAAYPSGATVILEHGDNAQIAVVVGSIYDVGLNQTSVEVAGADVEESLSAVRYAYTQPRRFDNYAFGETGKVTKDFRLLSIRRSGDLQYELAGLEYAEYTEATDIPAPVVTEPAGSVTHLTATESKDPDGTRWCNISWVPPRVNYTGARIVVDGVQVGRVGIEATVFRFPVETGNEITIVVTALDRWGMDYGSASIQFTPVDTTPMAAPTNVVATTIPRGVAVDMDNPNDVSWAFTKVYISTVDGFMPDDNINLADQGKKTHFEIIESIKLGALIPETTYYIKAIHVNTRGIESAASIQVSAVAGQYQGTDIEPATLPYGAVDPLMVELFKALVVDPCVLTGWRLPSASSYILDIPAEKDQTYSHVDDRWIAWAHLMVGRPAGGYSHCFAIKFDSTTLSTIDGNIIDAEIILYCGRADQSSPGTTRIRIYKLTSELIEGSGTLPIHDIPELFQITHAVNENTYRSIKNPALLSVVQDWVAVPVNNHGLMFNKDLYTEGYFDAYDDRHYEDEARRPKLRLTIQPVSTNLILHIPSGSGYIAGKLVRTNATAEVDLTGHPDGTYYIAAVYDVNLTVTIDHLSTALLTTATAAGDNHLHVDAVPVDWAAGKLIHIGPERHKILSIDGTQINLDGTTIGAAYAIDTLVSLATPPETGIILGTATKSGTSYTVDESPRTGRKDLAGAFSRMGLGGPGVNGNAAPAGDIWIGDWHSLIAGSTAYWDHNLDGEILDVRGQFRANDGAEIANLTDFEQIETGGVHYFRGTTIKQTSPTRVTFHAASTSVQIECSGDGGAVVGWASGQVRPIIYLLRRKVL